jgi:hypothetical protein
VKKRIYDSLDNAMVKENQESGLIQTGLVDIDKR